LKGDHERLRYHRRITQFYLIFCGLQSQACGTAACFVTFLLALQALVWRPIHATVRAGASKCLAIQDRLPIYGARTSMASVRPLREKVDALYLNHIPNPHQRGRSASETGQHRWSGLIAGERCASGAKLGGAAKPKASDHWPG
jgi:hypothetical protein